MVDDPAPAPCPDGAATDRPRDLRAELAARPVTEHVAVLEGAGLVTKETQGRERIVRGNPERVARARDLLTQLEGLWTARFRQLDRVLTTPDPQE